VVIVSAKGKATRKNIIESSLHLFSVKGYFNASINDILQATGLTKGGLYCHFKSKEEIWRAVYEEAVKVWRSVVFAAVRSVDDPLDRIKQTVENVLLTYLGDDTFEGGCFFVNMLVELSGQSDTMGRRIVKGFVGFSKLFQSWLREAELAGILKENLNHREIADFTVTSLNGAATLYMSTRDQGVLNRNNRQIHFYLEQLRKS
jgi:TetR/AcrR family transcriptional repressor of nem operon